MGGWERSFRNSKRKKETKRISSAGDSLSVHEAQSDVRVSEQSEQHTEHVSRGRGAIQHKCRPNVTKIHTAITLYYLPFSPPLPSSLSLSLWSPMLPTETQTKQKQKTTIRKNKKQRQRKTKGAGDGVGEGRGGGGGGADVGAHDTCSVMGQGAGRVEVVWKTLK